MLHTVLFLTLASSAHHADVEAAHGPVCENELTERLAEADALLAVSPIGTSEVGGGNAVLAVWRPGEAVRSVRVRRGVSTDPKFLVELVNRNGVNTEYRVNAGEGWLVLGLRTNVRDRRYAGGSRPVVYHPFTPEILDDALVLEGRAHLDRLIADAYRGLAASDVASAALPDLPVTEVVPRNVLITLLVIEHITPDELDARGVAWTVDKTLATIGMNKEQVYDFARSRAGAFGIAQFIPRTYATVRRAYPAAGLIRDFTSGMIDDVNAVKAQACLADRIIAVLDHDDRSALLNDDTDEELGAFLAAAYNGGEIRARSAYLYDRERWETAGFGLFPETVTYVRVFRQVHRYLFPN